VTPEPPPPSDARRYHGSAPGPAGFRGIGGHLIRPSAPTPDSVTPSALWTEEIPASHGAHLLSPILQGEDGARSSLCPVCRTPETLASKSGWVGIRCQTCGTEFVATDGSPPPTVLPLPPPPTPAPLPAPRRSPIAPPSPLEPLPVGADYPRGFTSDVRLDAEGRMSVICPQCRRAEVFVPPGTVALRCPVCHNPFLVGLRPDKHSAPEPSASPDPVPLLPPLPFNPDGRVWDYCPRCGHESLTPDRIGEAFVLTCSICGQQVLVSEGPYPPRLPALPALPSIWERIRRWFGG
jgi:ribosomal protein S27E